MCHRFPRGRTRKEDNRLVTGRLADRPGMLVIVAPAVSDKMAEPVFVRQAAGKTSRRVAGLKCEPHRFLLFT